MDSNQLTTGARAVSRPTAMTSTRPTLNAFMPEKSVPLAWGIALSRYNPGLPPTVVFGLPAYLVRKSSIVVAFEPGGKSATTSSYAGGRRRAMSPTRHEVTVVAGGRRAPRVPGLEVRTGVPGKAALTATSSAR